ncbi:MAG: beta-hydroxyacyl-ACP dehydratase [Oscillospiraceae bacterium]|nr:beta-hydroxyacyl-ACP dehydratase [Oscillospiraceae bacterium]
MNQEQIRKILPHRDNMLLLDEVGQEGGFAHGKYHVRGNEWFLQGHFPGNPVMPGVIQCEILAQSACVLLSDAMSAGKTPMYTGLNNVRFKSPVRPGETFETRCRITRSKGPFFFAEGEGFVGERLCLKAEFSFAIVGE